MGAAGDADLGGHQHVAADADAMPDLHQVVQLGPGTDARLAHRRPVHRGVGAELDVVLDDHRRHLRNLLVRAIATPDEAIAVTADDHAVLQDDPVAHRAPARGSRRSRE